MTDDCVVRSFGDAKPFHARYELRGIDSHVAVGVASWGGQEVTILSYDGDPGGGGGDAHPMISQLFCGRPIVFPSYQTHPENTVIFVCGDDRRLGPLCE